MGPFDLNQPAPGFGWRLKTVGLFEAKYLVQEQFDKRIVVRFKLTASSMIPSDIDKFKWGSTSE